MCCSAGNRGESGLIKIHAEIKIPCLQAAGAPGVSVEPEQRGAALENEQLGMCLILSFHGNCPWEVNFPLQALGQGYLANLSDRGPFARLAEG